ncbi:phage head closure protein [Morganella sp. EGD-HP17]|uniref:phage head closure protein n=1 Tax=Morganella sp. EGD-HP17 TaxID=1435146 RepID=UPI000422A4C7|nr:phage head closure protein [Morganella sp. EGD-HP17]ETO44533.1 head-tail adaptor [Morganella sp. EGD-HP17]
MRAGHLRHRITIRKQETYEGSLGDQRTRWVDVATVWAEVKAIGGRELLSSGTVYAEATLRIWLRYRPDINTDNLIVVHDGNTQGDSFDVVAVIPDPKRTRLELLCKGGAAYA